MNHLGTKPDGVGRRHKWEKKTIETGEETKCLKCGIIKRSLGWIGGIIYFFETSKYYYQRSPDCGVIEVEILSNPYYSHHIKHEHFNALRN